MRRWNSCRRRRPAKKQARLTSPGHSSFHGCSSKSSDPTPPPPHPSPDSSSSNCTHWLPSVLLCELTPAFLTSERASLNGSVLLSQPFLSLTKWREMLQKEKLPVGNSQWRGVTPTLGSKKNLRIIANEARGALMGRQ